MGRGSNSGDDAGMDGYGAKAVAPFSHSPIMMNDTPPSGGHCCFDGNERD